MENTERCPRCYKVPDVTIETNQIVLSCPEHGHMAVGKTLDIVKQCWNLYITLIRKAA